MVYRWLAELVVVCHVAFVAFVVLGALVVVRWPRAAWVHVPAVAWGVLVEVYGWTCPLTPLENAWRAQAAEAGYQGDFVEHYLLGALYPAGLTRTVQWGLGALVLVLNVGVYAILLARRRQPATPREGPAAGREGVSTPWHSDRGRLLRQSRLSISRALERLFSWKERGGNPREGHMRYLCMIFFDERTLDALPKSQSQALIDASLDYDDTLRKGNHLVAAQALESVHAATTVRVKAGGKLSITNGPFAETNEQIGGFILIEAADLNEAIRLASKHPGSSLGGVEVRPIKELTHSAAKA